MAIHSDTRTIHTIYIDLPDDVVGKIQAGDQVEVMFNSRTTSGRIPRPQMMSWAMLRYIMGDNN